MRDQLQRAATNARARIASSPRNAREAHFYCAKMLPRFRRRAPVNFIYKFVTRKANTIIHPSPMRSRSFR
jgi:hypothetical protein